MTTLVTVNKLTVLTASQLASSTYVIADTLSNIQSALPSLLTKIADYSSIEITPPTATITETSANLVKYAAVLNKITGGYTNLSISGSITTAQLVILDVYSNGFLQNLSMGLTVSDSATNVLNNINGLNLLFSTTAAGGFSELASVSITGAVTAANLELLERQSFAADVNLNGTKVSGNLSVQDALYATIVNGKYAQISDTVSNIESTATGVQSALAATVSTIYVTGPVTASDLNILSALSFVSKLNLSGSAISGLLTVTEAGFANAHHGAYATVTGTAANIESAAAVVGAAAGTVYVTGNVAASDVIKLSAAAYAGKVNLGGAQITGNLTVAEAVYVHAHEGVYANISDTAVNLESSSANNQTAVAAATEAVYVTGAVTASELITISAESYAAKINLSTAKISGNLTVAEAVYAQAQHGVYADISDTAANLESTAVGVQSAINAATTKIYVTGPVGANDLTALSAASYASLVNLQGSVISGSLTAAQAVYAHAQLGVFANISDSAANIVNSASIVSLATGTIYVTGVVIASDVIKLSVAGYAAKVNLGGAQITGNLTVAEAVYAHAHEGVYAYISDTAANIESTSAGVQTAVAAATGIINVTGVVAASDLNTLSAESYAGRIDLSGAKISTKITVAEAVYAHTQLGAYSAISDSAANIENSSAKAQTAITADSSAIYVTGTVTASDVNALTTESYAGNINLSSATIVGNLNVRQASQVQSHFGVYSSISDTAANIESTAAGAQTAISGVTGTIYVTGPVTVSDLKILSAAGYASKLNLSNATITGNLTVAEALFANTAHGVYSAISDTAANIESTATGVLSAIKAATTVVYVTGAVALADLVKLSVASYKSNLDLSGSNISLPGGATAAEANFVIAQNGSYQLLDSFANILASNSTVLANATSISLTGALTAASLSSLINASYSGLVNLSQANISGNINLAEADFLYTNHGQNLVYSISDTAANLLANSTDPALTGATSISISAKDSVDLTGLAVSDAQTLFDTLHAKLNGNTYSINDTAAALLANAADVAVTGAAAIIISAGDSSDLGGLTVSQAKTLLETLHVQLNGNTYSITDTAATLLANAKDPAVTGAAAISVTANDNGNLISDLTVSQAKTLFETLNGQPAVNYSITDTVANILANANDLAVTGATALTVSANDGADLKALTVAQAQTLIDTLQVQLGKNTYGITDTAANLLANSADAAVTGAASISISAKDSVDLTGLTVSVAQTLFDSLNAKQNGNTYSITDTAANLLANSTDSAVTGAGTITLSANDSADLTGLAVSDSQTLFDTLHAKLNGNTYSINDTAANLLANAADSAVTGAASIIISAGDSSDLGSLTVTQAQTLLVTLHAHLNGNTYSITDTAANLLANAQDQIVTGAASISVTANNNGNLISDLTVSQAKILFDTLNGQPAVNYSITDTAANILANANDAAVTGASALSISANDGADLKALSVSQAQTLVDTLQVQLNKNTYGITDTAANLLANSTDAAVTGAASITLSAKDSADLTGLAISDAQTLFDTLHAKLNGNIFSINDTAANLLANITDIAVIGAASIIISAGDSSDLGGLTVSQAQTLFDTFHAQLNGNTYSITDTAVNLLANAKDPAVTGASSINVTANDNGNLIGDLTVSQAKTLFDTLNAQPAVNYSITDTVANILTNANDAAVTGASVLTVSANDGNSLKALTVSQAQTLFDNLQVQVGNNTYGITDTAANLLAKSTDSAVTGAALISISAKDGNDLNGLSVSDAQTLFDSLNANLNGNTYSIIDTAANLLANSTDSAVTGASTITLSAKDGADLTGLAVSDAQTLFDTLHAKLNGNTYSINDTAVNLLANAADPAVTGAAAIIISAGDSGDLTGLTVSQAQTLFSTLHAQLNGNSYSVSDTITAVENANQSIIGSAASVLITGTVNTGDLESLIQDAKSYSGKIDLSSAIFSDTLSVADAGFAYQNGGLGYSISDTVSDILNGANQAAIAGASFVYVSGALNDTIVEALANSVYSGNIDLSNATFSSDVNLNDASYAYQQNGQGFSVADTVANLLAGDQTALLAAVQVVVTGASQFSNLDTLIDTLATDGYANTNMSHLTITGTLTTTASDAATVSQYLSNFGSITASTGAGSLIINDTAADVLNNVSGDQLASSIQISGLLTKTQLDSLMSASSYEAKLQFGPATVSGGVVATEASFLLNDGYASSGLAVKDTTANLLSLTPKFDSAIESGLIVTSLTDTGVKGSITSTGGSNVDLVLTSLTANLTISANTNNLTNIDISAIDASSGAYTDSLTLTNGVSNEIITVANHTIDLVGVNNLLKIAIHG
jgi:hypothetical protein